MSSDENQHIAFLKSKIDENLANKNYASAAENQSTLTNLENWTKELQKAVDEKRYADASSLDGKIKKIYSNLNVKCDIKEQSPQNQESLLVSNPKNKMEKLRDTNVLL